MSIPAPHFVLFSETSGQGDEGEWRFVLTAADGSQQLIAADSEPDTYGERLELLSVVRGLEALEQPSHVTILTDSRFVAQGLTHGLVEWRENDWCWERFGELTPVKHSDLWRRVDRALKFHQVECRTWRFDPPHKPAAPIRPPRDSRPRPESDRDVTAAAHDCARPRRAACQGVEHESPEAGRPRWSSCRNWVAGQIDRVKKLAPQKLQLAS